MERTPAPTPGAALRLEVRVGPSRPASYEVGDGGFLVGAVPGCDLRLPGATLPPVVCLIARHAGGASLRKLAAVLPVKVNGRPVASTYLADGDTVQIGPAELVVRLAAGQAAPADLDDRLRDLAARERQLEQHRQELEKARLLLQQHREELARQPAPAADSEEVARRKQEVDALQQELAKIRQELAERFHHRRDRILTQQQAIRRAARKVRLRKAAVEVREARAAQADQEAAGRQAELDAGREQLGRERQLVEEQHRLFASRQQEVQRELHDRVADLEAREGRLAKEKADLERGQKQHQSDLVRLDRIQATSEQRQRQLNERALEIDRRYEQLQRDTRDLEEQATQLDEWHTRLTAEQGQVDARKAELEATAAQVEQRAAALEGQQAMLATLRTRLERGREELRQQEQALSDQRAMCEATEADVKERLEEAERLKSDLRNDRELFDEERRRAEERRRTLDEAVARLREAQESLERQQGEFQARRDQVEAASADQQEQAALLLARGEKVERLGEALQAERQALRERETTLARAEQTLAGLQEQVRKRVEDLEARSRQVGEREQAMAAREAEQQEHMARLEQANQRAAAELDQVRQELEGQTRKLLQREGELARRADTLTVAGEQHSETRQSLESMRRGLEAERVAFELERQAARERDREARQEFDSAREVAQQMIGALPELEWRAASVLERLAGGREQLREHLAEVHAYARQSRDDLEAARKQLQAESDRLRQRELELEKARDEQRLAVAAFRQQLVEWQGRVAEMRQALQAGSSRLEEREAEIEARAREVEDTSARLAEEVARVESERRAVAERRGEMDRHLGDMRDWYRRKLRELAKVALPPGAEPGEGDVVPMPAPAASESGAVENDRSPARAVLTLNDEVEPADRQLGELLASMGLVEDDTLQALWAEARRQRRSLRQLLLAGGYMTLYQMALIEAGNLSGLVLGPLQVIDKLPSTPREAVYRVRDPHRNAEAVLRHLAESEMHDAVRPDEFEQRFAAAACVRHTNVAAVLEVLKVASRPAALVEWVSGLAAADWPAVVSAPGVWYRLVSQAALALDAVHGASLTHGHLDAGSLVLTGDGMLKLVGLGEPRWLTASVPLVEGETAQADLAALGQLAAGWAAMPAGGKSKPWPEELQAVLERLKGGEYPSARALVEDLEMAGAKVQASNAAWERLVRQARDSSAPGSARRSA
ncbi:MAG: hypothetical protein U0797_19110 [Gemmataceae bacterium]